MSEDMGSARFHHHVPLRVGVKASSNKALTFVSSINPY